MLYTFPVQERLQKILSARGIASRRKSEEYISQGLVTVNGKVAVLGQKADPEIDVIEVSGKVLDARREFLYYLFSKPRGIVTTNADQPGDKTVRDLLPKELQGKIVPVGRLDKDSEGLLLLTNDGVLAYRLTHPKFDHEKEYEVTVEKPVFDGALEKLRKGITLSGEKTKPATVERTGISVFRIAITEGRNRQIRRMCQKIGSPVTRLKRVRIVTLEDETLEPGKLRPLSKTELQDLFRAVGLDAEGQVAGGAL